MKREGGVERPVDDHHLGHLGIVGEAALVLDRGTSAEDQVLAPIGRRFDPDHLQGCFIDDDAVSSRTSAAPASCHVWPSIW